MELAWHITTRLEDSRALTRGPEQRRAFARTVLRVGRDRGLFAFGLPDNHGHFGVEGSREDAGRFAHAVECALQQALGPQVPFAPARVREIVDQCHLDNAFHYMLGQARRHEVEGDPWLEGTSLPDLLGLRVTGVYTAPRIRSLLPRTRREQLLRHLGIGELEPGTGLEGLADAAASAICAPDLAGCRPQVVEARRAAIGVGTALGAGSAELARRLGLTPRAVQRLGKVVADPALVRAVSLQLGLREAVRETEPVFVHSGGAKEPDRAGR